MERPCLYQTRQYLWDKILGAQTIIWEQNKKLWKNTEVSKDRVGRDVLDHIVHPLVAAANCPLETEDISYFIKYSQKARRNTLV